MTGEFAARLRAFADKMTVASARHRVFMWYCVGTTAFLFATSAVWLVRDQILGFILNVFVALVFLALALFHRIVARAARELENSERDEDTGDQS